MVILFIIFIVNFNIFMAGVVITLMVNFYYIYGLKSETENPTMFRF